MNPQRQRRKTNSVPGVTGGDRRRAVQRGAAFERWVAGHNDGLIWPGPDGDVDAHGYRIECKLRAGLTAYGALADHIEQAQRNSEASGKPWVLALTGGKEYQNYAVFALVPFEEWERLSRLEDDRRALEPLKQPSGTPFRALVNAFHELAHQMAEELRGRNCDDNPDPGGETAGEGLGGPTSPEVPDQPGETQSLAAEPGPPGPLESKRRSRASRRQALQPV